MAGIGWGFVARLGWDLAWGKLADNEVARARELREIVTSLGPAYIKLGQALSIRPDILSPAAMYEMQKLCDKVDADLACSASVVVTHSGGLRQALFTAGTISASGTERCCRHNNSQASVLKGVH